LTVAPHAGAWIETEPATPTVHQSCVAPHAGAWIETQQIHHQAQSTYVAPHAGAWIETDKHDLVEYAQGGGGRGLIKQN
jgi:hypothetical protein